MAYEKKRWTCFSVMCPKSFEGLKKLKCLIDQYSEDCSACFTDIFFSKTILSNESLLYCSIYSTEEQWWRFFDILTGDCCFKCKGWYDAGPSHASSVF